MQGEAWVILYLAVWTIVNGLTLTRFPHLHSDEAWLAGLAKAYLANGSFTVTEPFFDLFPRQPHAFKMLFHIMQSVFIQLFGFDLFAVRLLSLCFSVVTLVFLYLGLKQQTGHRSLASCLMIALSLQPLFLTTAHLARQESIILACMAIALAIVPTIRQPHQGVWFGALLGLGALIHPNALFPAALTGLIMLKDTLARRSTVKVVLGYTAGLAGAAMALLGLSLLVNPAFLRNYAEFGANLAVDALPNQRGENLSRFFRQLWQQDNGTYWLPDLRVLLVAIPLLALLALAGLAFHGFGTGKGLRVADPDGLENGLIGLAGFFLVLIIIGRFNPTSIVFILVPIYNLTGHPVLILMQSPFSVASKRLGPRLAALLVAGIMLASAGSILRDIGPFFAASGSPGRDPYQVYLEEIRTHLPDQAIVLGNLSAGFTLQDSSLAFYDIRNLAYTMDGLPDGAGDLNVVDYLRQRQVNTVVWYEEYDFILRNPDWWVLYEIRPGRTADPTALRELKAILEQQGQLIHTFSAPIYGTRAIRYQGDYPWLVSLYALDPAGLVQRSRTQTEIP